MDALAVLARTLLPRMMDGASGLFAHKARSSPTGLRPLGANPLYSAMSAVGIQTDLSFGASWPISLGRTLDVLSDRIERPKCAVGLLGTTLWALALGRDQRTKTGLAILERQFSPTRTATADLGLLLAGIAAAAEAFPELRDRANTVGKKAKLELLRRLAVDGGLFRSTAARLQAVRPVANSATFATQVYPIHGLARYAELFEDDVPLEIRSVSERLVEAQGPAGQWWWVYSPRTGDVLDGYPVYSVHQDAMAFMAFAPLENMGIGSYRTALARGLEWIFGSNELGRSLVDLEKPFVSRCIQRTAGAADARLGMSRSQRRGLALATWRLRRPPGTVADPARLEILSECRSYHLGWILYARSLIRDRGDSPTESA